MSNPETKPAPKHSDFLMFIGESFYDKASFIEEAKTLGVSKRLPSYRVGDDMVIGQSRVWLAAGGSRKAEPGVIFGYFTPDALEFVAGEDGEKQYADVIAGVRKIKGHKIVWSVKGETKRRCGVRKIGGAYLVTSVEGGSPIRLTGDQAYEGQHFRGLMRLSPEQAEALADQKGLRTLVEDKCMDCFEPVLVGPSGAAEAARERRRMDKGEPPKRKPVLCPGCRKTARDEKRAAKHAAEAAETGAHAE